MDKLDPDTLVRAIGKEAFEALLGPPPSEQKREVRQRIGKLKLASLSHRLDHEKTTVVIVTGSQGWDGANRDWFQNAKLLLPFGEWPAFFRWPVFGKSCLVYGFGESETREHLLELSIALIKAGANLVQWAGQYRLDPQTGEARQVDGELFRIATKSAPIFKPYAAGYSHE